MKCMISGSRSLNDSKSRCIVFETLNEIHKSTPIYVLISGNANGIDKIAEEWATTHTIEIKKFIPEWEKYKKAAGLMCNKKMLEESDKLIAFWDGKSKGTKHAIEMAMRTEKILKIVKI